MNNSCECSICQSACKKRSGWFAPGEVAKAAELLGMPEKEFFDKYIAVDYFTLPELNHIWILAPATENAEPGKEYPFDPHGKCVFYQNGKCAIHEAKPDECRFYLHDTPNEVATEHRNGIVEKWKENKEEITRLLGREPEMSEPTIADIMSLMFSDLKYKFGFKDINEYY